LVVLFLTFFMPVVAYKVIIIARYTLFFYR
jgi:hypothetical protein